MHFVKARSILSQKNGMNIYRGCSHGCIYCDSRSACYQMPHAFEDIEVKENAPELLDAALRSKRSRCMIGTGAMCDPYLHEERELKLTRRCLEKIAEHGFGVSLLTKSDLILRDIDLIEQINRTAKAVVQMTLTTADDDLCKLVEPNVCPTSQRLKVLREMNRRGIPTTVWFCPLLPFINDTEENVRAIVEMSADVKVYGILSFGMGMTLRSGDREYYYSQLDRLFPGLKQRYIKEFGDRYEIPSPNGGRLWTLFTEQCDRLGIERCPDAIFSYLSEFPEPEQFTLF